MSRNSRKTEHIHPAYDRQKPFNALPELPPPVKIYDHEVLLKWGYAARALAGLNRNILRIPNPSIFVNTLSLREARSSSAIENIFTTDDELYKAVSDTAMTGNIDARTKEVLRYREALWQSYQGLLRRKTVDMPLILRTYRQVMNVRLGIRPPEARIVIRRGASEFKSGEVIYTPPRGTALLTRKLDNMIHFLNHGKDIDPLLKMAIAHYQFEAIHPFTDGNGRTGRILNLLYLVQQKLLSHPVLYLSSYIIRNKEEYYHHLAGVTQRGAWKPWLLYMMEGVEVTAEETNRTIDLIIGQMNQTYEKARKSLKWYSMELNYALYSQPYTRQRLVAMLTRTTSRTTLSKYMQQLTGLGILKPRPDGREMYYINTDLLRLLAEDGDAS